MWVLVFKIKCMFLQARVDKAKLQQDVQRQGRQTLSSWTTIACSRLTTSTSSTWPLPTNPVQNQTVY